MLQVALLGALAAERERLVGQADVQRVAVELGVDRDGADAELAARADDAHRDLAAIGDEHLVEHAVPPRTGPGSRGRSPYGVARVGVGLRGPPAR